MKTKTLLAAAVAAGAIYWVTRPKPVVIVTEVMPPPNSGPVVNGLGNIFNSQHLYKSLWRRPYAGVPQQTGTRPMFAAPLQAAAPIYRQPIQVYGRQQFWRGF